MIEEMAEQGHDMAIYFYNPNIHPRLEYNLRKEENKTFAAKLGIEFIDEDYDADKWYKLAKGMEMDPERGARCTMCFDMRLDKTAQYAATHGFDTFTTTNATSRWKDVDQVNGSGVRAGKMWGVDYWIYDWQTDKMTERKYQINAEQTFYKQQYCGCSFSLRDSNQWREEEGMEPIKIGATYYHDPVEDAKEESREVVDAFFDEYDHRNQTRDAKKEARKKLK
jgi:predicted adenine nucleotide alpha hydrolase (AANH) superfamily ATPase